MEFTGVVTDDWSSAPIPPVQPHVTPTPQYTAAYAVSPMQSPQGPPPAPPQQPPMPPQQAPMPPQQAPMMYAAPMQPPAPPQQPPMPPQQPPMMYMAPTQPAPPMYMPPYQPPQGAAAASGMPWPQQGHFQAQGTMVPMSAPYVPPAPVTTDGELTLQHFLDACIRDDKPFLVANLTLMSKYLNQQNESGHCMVYCAARNNSINCLQFLCDSGANIHIRQQSVQSTALHAAAWYGAKDAVQLLLEKGAASDVKNTHGLTPKDEAQMSENPNRRAILELFERFSRPAQLPSEMVQNTQAQVDPQLLARLMAAGYKEPEPIRWIIKTGEHANLIPNIPFTRTPDNETPPQFKVEPGTIEWNIIEKAMNTSILTCHESTKKTPYVRFDIDEITRHQNPATLSTCQACPNDDNVQSYLFHGTSKAAVQSIFNGFEQSVKGDFGSGIYFADHASVSNLFARDKKNDDGYQYMILCYVNIGKVEHQTKAPEGGSLGRFKEGNTVIITHLKYREYIVYNARRVYPAYVIKYKEVPLSQLEH